jgi:septum formation protein
VLASASPARLRLLRDAGFDPKVVVSGIDESQVRSDDPWNDVQQLAVAKATAVADGLGAGFVVVGCDSMLLLDGRLFGKAATRTEVIERWQSMRGRSGVLLTGHCVIDTTNGRSALEVGDTVVRFGTPTDAEIATYADTDEAFAVAGSFTIDGRAAMFVDGIEGDAGNVIGISLLVLHRLLAQLNVDAVSLWS